ncbi:hypothetical protein N7447_004751 [Penicillium robsamsonii]|uniref:uncharacterized protein n=1 Tax=Penicillium robsamsonii TaxID=1792511 RepID=UPI0025478DCF|nr:uncharacterized protein N7447_004751 [Penicillium robsamsonii]KAJ5822411.1 hypothetical protein N7447_004751 [Penicillium robsamsonii]
MGMEWATKNIIISTFILIIKYGRRHHHRLDTNLPILCNNPIHHHYNHSHIHHHRLDTSTLILCLLLILSLLLILCLLIPHTHTHPKNQIVRRLLNQIHAL